MADAGVLAADRAHALIVRRLRTIYRQAQKDIIAMLDQQTKAMVALDKVKRAALAAGAITEKDYKTWLMGQMFTQKQWMDKVNSVASTLLHANRQANNIVELYKRSVFGENATFAAFQLEKGMDADLSFSIYDSATVTRLLRDQPELLPRKVVDGVKDKAWNRRKIANAVSQGIIQGDAIPDIAQRIAKQTASDNMAAMTRYARTAMTSAQNAGRMEVMHEAEDMGIRVQKKWLATLDKKTRDAHAHLDGQVVDVDEPFHSDLGDIMYPGDPSAAPANVYNCRCTLTYVYPNHVQGVGARRDNENGSVIGDMTYSQWRAYKSKGVLG